VVGWPWAGLTGGVRSGERTNERTFDDFDVNGCRLTVVVVVVVAWLLLGHSVDCRVLVVVRLSVRLFVARLLRSVRFVPWLFVSVVHCRRSKEVTEVEWWQARATLWGRPRNERKELVYVHNERVYQVAGSTARLQLVGESD